MYVCMYVCMYVLDAKKHGQEARLLEAPSLKRLAVAPWTKLQFHLPPTRKKRQVRKFMGFRMWREKFVATRYVIRLRIHQQPRNKGWVMSQDYVCSIPSQGRQLKRWGRQLKTCSRNARAIQHERHALRLSAGKSVLSQWPCRKCTRFGEGCCSEQPHTKLFHPLKGNIAC